MLSTTIIIAGGNLQSIMENQPITNNEVAAVAAYDATNKPITDLSGFKAKINWGDGKPASDGTIGPKVSGNYFAIEGSHTYEKPGYYPISVQVTADDGTSSDEKVESANVKDAPITSTPRVNTVTAGQNFNITLADLFDANPASKATDFTPTVHWNDNSPADIAQMNSTGTGQYELSGSHTYTTAGQHWATVSVTDAYGELTTVSCLVNVAVAPATPATPPANNPTLPTLPDPGAPNNPAAPANPANPANPTTPTNPATPSTPTVPTTPATPVTPTNPTPAPANPITPSDPIAWGKRVSADFKAKVIQIASDLGADPNDLMTVMAYQTGQTFSPKIKRNGGVGLLGFTPAMAASLGTSTAKIAKMSAVQQLDYVERFLQPYAGKLNSATDIYMAIIDSAAVDQPDDFAVFKKGTAAYSKNKGLDANRNGIVTRGEAAARVIQALEAGETPANLG